MDAKRNKGSALQARVNRKLEALNMMDEVSKIKNLINWVIFDVFEPELTTDAARERVFNKLKEGPAAKNEAPVVPAKRGRGAPKKASKMTGSSETMKTLVGKLITNTAGH
jgi:hypothetical protein